MKGSRWVLATGGVAGLLAVLVATPFVRDQLLQFTRAWRERSDGAELAHRLVSSDSLLEYSVEHPNQVALASWEIGDEANGIYYNALRSQPAAHASALLVLAAHASAADPEQQGRAAVSIEHWERYGLPGTEGAAHAAALLDARARGVSQDEHDNSWGSPETPRGSVHLSDVVRAMLRHADPAATALLIDSLGRTRLSEHVLSLGFPVEAVPLPASGVQLSLLSDAAAPELLARFRSQSHGAYADAVWAALGKLRDDSELSAGSLERLAQRGGSVSLRESAELTAALEPRATAAAYAHLMQRIVNGELSGASYMRGQLEQPLGSGRARPQIEQYGGVQGAEPGVYASVAYGRARGAKRTRVFALMLCKLPIGVWLQLSSGGLLRRFELELLSDDAFFEQAKLRLRARGRDDDGAEAAADVWLGRGR